jgi:hypothetical protein
MVTVRTVHVYEVVPVAYPPGGWDEAEHRLPRTAGPLICPDRQHRTTLREIEASCVKWVCVGALKRPGGGRA